MFCLFCCSNPALRGMEMFLHSTYLHLHMKHKHDKIQPPGPQCSVMADWEAVSQWPLTSGRGTGQASWWWHGAWHSGVSRWHHLKHFSCVLSLVSLYHQCEYLFMFLSLWNTKQSQNGGLRRDERIEQDQLVSPRFYSNERVPNYHEKSGDVVIKQTEQS